MLKALIVEDELLNSRLLETLLNDFCKNVEVSGIASSVQAAYDQILDNPPDVVFLDIEMQSETGFDLLNKFKEIPFSVVFTTAYEKYALRAIKFSAVDYLLKPIDIDDLRNAIAKVEKRHKLDNLRLHLDVLMQNLKTSQKNDHQIALSTSDALIFVKVNDIMYCESNGPYTTFFLQSGDKIMTSRTLKEYEELLEGHDFYRIHHSFLVNIKEIRRYIRGEGGQVQLSNGKMLDVSKRKKDAFLKLLNQ